MRTDSHGASYDVHDVLCIQGWFFREEVGGSQGGRHVACAAAARLWTTKRIDSSEFLPTPSYAMEITRCCKQRRSRSAGGEQSSHPHRRNTVDMHTERLRSLESSMLPHKTCSSYLHGRSLQAIRDRQANRPLFNESWTKQRRQKGYGFGIFTRHVTLFFQTGI